MPSIRLPNGVIINNIPDGFTKKQVQELALSNNLAFENDFLEPVPETPSLALSVQQANTEDAGVPLSSELSKIYGEEPSFATDQAKAGAADLVFNMVPDYIMQGILNVKPLDPAYRKEDGMVDVESFNRDYAAAKENLMKDFFGYKGIKPAGEIQRYVGSGVRSVVGEGPMAIVGAKGKIGAGVELLHSLASAISGQVGAEVAYNVAKDAFGAGDTGAKIAANITGMITGAAPSFLRTGGTTVAHYAGAAKDSATNFKTEKERFVNGIEQADSYLQDTQLRGIIDAATTVQPDIADVVRAAKDLEDLIPNLSIAPAAILADNPIYRYNTDKLNKTNPEFRARLIESLKGTKKAIDDRRFSLFGETGSVMSKQLRDTLPVDYSKNLRNAKKRIDAIDFQMAKVSDSLSPRLDLSDVGDSVRNLMRAKEAAVKSRLQPEYTRILDKASSEGMRMPKESVAAVYNNVRLLKAEDVFAGFPDLARQINTKWSPIPILRDGVEVGKTFRNVKIQEVDSLKRALNKALRSTKDADAYRKLADIKNTFTGEVSKLPSDFSAAYQDLDLQFYKELGIPLNAAGAKQLTAARFQTQVGSYLSKPEQAKDFLNFVGDAGIPIVKDSILLKMASSNVLNKDGIVDPKNLDRFITANKRLIDTVPNFREELSDVRTMMQVLPAQQQKMDAQYNIEAKRLASGFYKGVYEEDLSNVVTKILNKPSESDKYFRDVKNFESNTAKMLRQGVRAEMVEKALTSDGSALGFIEKHQTAFDRWFGNTYMKDIKAIAQASDLLNKYDLSKMRFAVDFKNNDIAMQKTNMSFPEYLSLARDRITSTLVKFGIAGSKIATRSVAKSRDSELVELMLQPEKLAQLSKDLERIKEYSIKGKTDVVLNSFKELSGKLLSVLGKGIYFGAVGAEAGIEAEKNKPIRNPMPTMPQQGQAPVAPTQPLTLQPPALINGLPAEVQNPLGMLSR